MLDPGCGNMILSAAVIEYAIKNKLCRDFSITAVENDSEIGKELSGICKIICDYVHENHGEVRFNIVKDNFILTDFKTTFDIVICNPPYKKLRKDSEESQKMNEVVYGQPNLYGFFMAKGVSLLRENGRFAYITPRSWTSGQYYALVRESILETVSIEDIVLFQERDNVFKEENVLQETVIVSGKWGKSQNKCVSIHTVTGDFEKNIGNISVSCDLIMNVGENHCLVLPTSTADIDVLKKMGTIQSNLRSLGYTFKTGPVVEFRNLSYLSNVQGNNSVPMIRSANIVDGKCIFPANVEKAQYVSSTATHLLIRNSPTVFVKRITAKEEKRRIQSCVYYPSTANPYISVENHVNYLVRIDGRPLTINEAERVNIQRNYEMDYHGKILSFEKNEHNKLQMRILNDLFPLIAKDKPELLYIGDASNRHLVCERKRLEEIGIKVISDSSKLPDIIAYDKTNKRILFIEAYYSGGAFTVNRVKNIKDLCACPAGTEAAFITAFDTTNKMLKAYKNVAWDTEMWAADEPTHLVHKNGDKFIGRLL